MAPCPFDVCITVAKLDGDQIFAGLESGELLKQTINDEQSLTVSKLSDRGIECISFLRDPHRIAVGIVDGTLKILDHSDLTKIAEARLSKGSLNACQWLDSEFLCTGSSTGKVSIWRFANGQLTNYVTLLDESRPVVDLKYNAKLGVLLVQIEGRYGLVNIDWKNFLKSLEDLGLR